MLLKNFEKNAVYNQWTEILRISLKESWTGMWRQIFLWILIFISSLDFVLINLKAIHNIICRTEQCVFYIVQCTLYLLTDCYSIIKILLPVWLNVELQTLFGNETILKMLKNFPFRSTADSPLSESALPVLQSPESKSATRNRRTIAPSSAERRIQIKHFLGFSPLPINTPPLPRPRSGAKNNPLNQ
jgi:hypothetical protein